LKLSDITAANLELINEVTIRQGDDNKIIRRVAILKCKEWFIVGENQYMDRTHRTAAEVISVHSDLGEARVSLLCEVSRTLGENGAE
jgi:hypothetical protein